MIHFTVNETEPAQCPSCWAETTTRIYQRLAGGLKKGDNDVKLFSLLSGTNYAELWVDNREDLDAAIYQAVAFVGNEPQDFKKAPRAQTFRLGDRPPIDIPKRIQKLTVGQNFAIRERLATMAKADPKLPLETLISYAMAVYLQPIIDQANFDPERAAELEEEILEMPIADTYPVGFFLLRRLTRNGGSGMRFWFRQRAMRLRSALRWPRWLRLRSSSPSSRSARLISTPRHTERSPA